MGASAKSTPLLKHRARQLTACMSRCDKKVEVEAITTRKERACVNAVSTCAGKCDQGGSRGGRRRCSVAMECKRRALHRGGANRYPKLGAVVGGSIKDADTSATFFLG